MRRPLAFAVLVLALASCAGRHAAVGARPAPERPEVPAPAVPPPQANGRLPPGVRPTHYHLELTVDPAQASFAGRARIAVDLERPTRVIVLHGRGLRILIAAVSTRAGKQRAKASPRRAAGSKNEPEELVLSVDAELPAGPALLDIEYEASFGTNLSGLYRIESGGKHFAFTQFEPSDARRAFPCFDEPGFKVPVDLTLSVPEGMTAFANMPELRRRENQPSKLTSFEFEVSPPLPSYLVAFAVGPLEVRPGARDPVPIRLLALPGKTKLGELSLEAARAEVELLAEYFGEPHPFPKLDIVAVPEFAAGAMENPGLVTFREELLLLEPERASVDARRSMAAVMAHELAHQWFGNLVTPAWWDDLWLNEAFATWMEKKIVDRFKPSHARALESVGHKHWVMSLDSLASARRIRQPVTSSSEALEAFDGITYTKGSAVLAMVERWLGEDVFRRGVRGFMARHRRGSATSEHLFASLREASGKDVGRVMSSFVDRTGVPLISITSRCQKRAPRRVEQRITLSQRPYRLLGVPAASDPTPWIVPVCVRSADQPLPTCFELDSPSAEHVIEAESCSSPLIANAGEAGYYRYQLTRESLRALMKTGLSGLTPAERVGLVGNSWALVKSGELDPADHLALLDSMKDEASQAVWDQMLSSLREMQRSLVSPRQEPAFALRVQKLVGPAARRLGFRREPAETESQTLLRVALLSALGDLGDDAWAREEATKLAERWLEAPATVDADVAQVALAVAAHKGDAKLFDRLLARAKSATLPEERLLAITGLTGFDDPALVERALGLVLDGTLKASELRYVIAPLAERPATGAVTYGWLRTHFDALAARLPNFVVGRFPWVLRGLCDEAKVEEGRRFFEARLKRVEGADKHLAQAVEAGKLCAALRAGQGAALGRALGGA